MKVKDLKETLNELSDDLEVKLSVTYDNCDHVQKLKCVYFDEGISWIVLSGR